MKKLYAIFLTILMTVTILAGVNFSIGTTSASAPPTPITNQVFLNTSLAGYTNAGTTNSPSTTLTAVENSTGNSYSLNFGIGTAESGTYNFGNIYYWAGTGVAVAIQATAASVTDISYSSPDYTVDWYYGGQTISLTLTIGSYSNTQSYNGGSSDSGTITSTNPKPSYPVYYDQVHTSFATPSLSTGLYAASLKVVVSTSVPSGYSATYQGGTAMTAPSSSSLAYLTSTSASQGTENYFVGWNYGGVSSSVSWTNPTGTVAIDAVAGTNTSSTTSGFYTGSLPTSSTLSAVGDPSSPSFSAQLFIENTVESASTTISNTTGITQTITQTNNEWSSTFAASFTPPSSWENGNSLDGKIWDTTLSSYTVQHVLSAGQQASTKPNYDVLYYSGTDISGTQNFNPPTLYNSWSESPGTTQNSAFSLSFTTNELINYVPNPITAISASFISGATADLKFTTSETIANEGESVVVHWGDGTQNTYSMLPGPQSVTHAYPTLGKFPITIDLTNVPSPSSFDSNTVTAYSVSTSTTYTVSASPSFHPLYGQSVKKGQNIYFNWTSSNWQPSSVSLIANGVGQQIFSSFAASGLSGSASWVNQFNSPLSLIWSLTGSGITQSYTVQYSSNLVPFVNSSYVNVAYATNTTHSYPITLTGTPAGTGYYQQLITITNYAQYGINSQGSNFLISASNGSNYYTWIQSINTTAITFWSKLPYGVSSVQLNVYPEFENLFSATGYLNDVTGQNIFPHWQSFAGLSSLPSGWIQTGGTITFGANNISFSSSDANAFLTSPWASANNFAYGSKDLITGTGNPGTGSNNFLSWISTSQTTYVNFYGVLLDANDFNFYYYQNATGPTESPLIGQTGSWYDSLIEYSGSSASLIENGQNVITGLPISNTIPDQYPGFLVNNGTLSIQYAFTALIGTSGMPTISSIGTGNVFQANATTTSAFTGTSAGNYNSTYENMIYNIPIAPNIDYVSILYNSTWTVSNIYPSTYLPLINNSDFVTLEDVLGFSSVQIELIEPNPFIGQLEPVSLSFNPSGV
ncbi:MAG: hypothetical protein KIS29_10530, partial [Thermoplasmata archaeon]|nr:hypothetical protein [Candidatus Sysuiplasma jiujiangense]